MLLAVILSTVDSFFYCIAPTVMLWGIPGVACRKVAEDESIAEALIRELREETGVTLAQEHIVYMHSVMLRHAHFDFEYHLFKANCDQRPHGMLNPQEHQSYAWVTTKESLRFDLIEDQDMCIRLCYDV